ncbi:hypothetical protein DRH29_04410 [candidate division Kazan bacterium]|uniref:SipW-cognate class signal peptide n=1 Tax=candidate division Kazan bacterium TaxID=2202143 RepID=A0A420ZBX8_UNCK3|nr:MAG: hypothetical protein DRH29_04410 [candidate division Kazan bacterium]
MSRKILTSLSVIGVVAALVIGATTAYFGDAETSTGNKMKAGSLDLKIDLQCENGLCGFPLRDLSDEPSFFQECDIKPGDSGEVTVSWHVDNDAWASVQLADVYDWEYGCPESEAEEDSSCGTPGQGEGELSQYLTFTFWMDEGSAEGWQCPDNKPCQADPEEGNNILDGIENPFAENIPASQLVEGVWLPIELIPSTVYYLGMQWHLPPETGNIVQTDSLSARILLKVIQSRHNPRPSSGGLTNGGFENGNFAGWEVLYPELAEVATSYQSYTGSEDNDCGTLGSVYEPKEGDYFAVLHAGAGEGVYTLIRQTVNLHAGQKLAGWAAFDAKDYLPYDDDSAVVIVSGGPLATPWQKAVHDVGNCGETPWQYWSWTAPADGTYTLELKVRNVEDNALPSSALFDANVIE